MLGTLIMSRRSLTAAYAGAWTIVVHACLLYHSFCAMDSEVALQKKRKEKKKKKKGRKNTLDHERM